MLKLNVGLSKKVGLPDYGSAGASVNLEVELDACIVGDADRLKERIRALFVLAKASVEEQLAVPHHDVPIGVSTSGMSNGNGNANGRRRDGTRKATASQSRALHVIADRRGIDLADLLRQRFGVDQAGDLAITEASRLIDELKGAENGTGGRR